MATIQIPIPRLSGMSLGTTGISILLHAAVLLALGGLIIRHVEPKEPPMAFIEPAALEPPPLLEEPELAEAEPDLSMPDSSLSIVETGLDVQLGDLSAAAAMALPTMLPVITAPSAPGLAGNAVSGNGSNPEGNGTGDRVGAGMRGKINIGTIFNTPVESNKLGVILDISSSAHRYLPFVVREISRNFPNAIIILAYGGGMYAKASADTMWLKELGNTKLGEPGATNTLGQIAKAEAASGDVSNVIKKFRARQGVHVLYAENCGHTHFGFEKLIKEKVDAIYWFSDFQDKINPRIADTLAADLKRKHIKVIAHNFSGSEVSAEGKQITAATGGSTIEQIPGGRRN
jgi:hypothetical protein